MADHDQAHPQITSRTRVRDVRRIAGFSEHGWLTFLRLTREQAQQMLSNENAPSSWTTVNYSLKQEMLGKLNVELERQGLPQINESIYHWRMGQALSPQIRQFNKSKECGDQPPEGISPTNESFPTPKEAGCVVLPPIRMQPELAQHLGKSTEDPET